MMCAFLFARLEISSLSDFYSAVSSRRKEGCFNIKNPLSLEQKKMIYACTKNNSLLYLIYL